MYEIELTCSKWRIGQGWEYKNSVVSLEKVSYEITAEECLQEAKTN